MKRILLLSAALCAVAGAAHAVTPDSETLTYKLSGEIASTCELVPEGTINYTVDMTNLGNQGFAAVAYSCNSPYTLTIETLNGGMRHVESNGAITVDYRIETFGFTGGSGAGPQVFIASQVKSNPEELDKVTTWESLLANAGIQTGNMDLIFPGLSEYPVAGTYKDEVKLVLKADL